MLKRSSFSHKKCAKSSISYAKKTCMRLISLFFCFGYLTLLYLIDEPFGQVSEQNKIILRLLEVMRNNRNINAASLRNIVTKLTSSLKINFHNKQAKNFVIPDNNVTFCHKKYFAMVSEVHLLYPKSFLNPKSLHFCNMCLC